MLVISRDLCASPGDQPGTVRDTRPVGGLVPRRSTRRTRRPRTGPAGGPRTLPPGSRAGGTRGRRCPRRTSRPAVPSTSQGRPRAFRSKSGSRGKIQDRKVQGRMASSASHRQMVASEMLEGTLVSTGSLDIHGEVNGEVSVQGEVVVTSESVVEADITAGSISLGGQIKGNLTAPGEVSLPPSSRVEGDVRARSVAVHGGVKDRVEAEDKGGGVLGLGDGNVKGAER